MAAPKGNRFWEARSSHGRKPIFETPEDLWEACQEYFAWVEDNPLWEDKVTSYQGENKHEPVAKMRAMTMDGLYIFLDIDESTWRKNYSVNEDFIRITTRVEKIIRTQKFAGAAADLLNANIIARELGLADKNELTGKGGGPIETKEVSDIEGAQRVAFMLGRALLRAKTEDDAASGS